MSFINEYFAHIDTQLEHHDELTRLQSSIMSKVMVENFRMSSLENSHNENRFNIFYGLTTHHFAYLPDYLNTVFPESEMRLMERENPAVIELVCKYQRELAEWAVFRKTTPDTIENAVLTICDVSDTLCYLRDRLMHLFVLKHAAMLEYLLVKHYHLEMPIAILMARATSEVGVSFRQLFHAVAAELRSQSKSVTDLDALFWVVYGAELVYLYNMENCRIREYSEKIVEECSQEYNILMPNQLGPFMERLEFLDNTFDTMPVTNTAVNDFAERMELTNPLYFRRYETMLRGRRFQAQCKK